MHPVPVCQLLKDITAHTTPSASRNAENIRRFLFEVLNFQPVSHHKAFQTIAPLCLSVYDVEHLEILDYISQKAKNKPPHEGLHQGCNRKPSCCLRPLRPWPGRRSLGCTASWTDFTYYGLSSYKLVYLHLYSEFMMVLITLGSKSSKTDLLSDIEQQLLRWT